MAAYQTKNYETDGGNTWVVGGTLTIEEGATVEGLPQGDAVANATEDTVVTQLNALLASLRAAGVIASE